MKTLILTFSFIVISAHSSAQITTAWIGQNENIVANNAIGSVAFHKYESTDITTQGGMNSIVQTGSVGINKFETLSFSVYPNPTNGYLLLKLPENTYVEIYNLQGVLVMITDSNRVDLSHLSSGTYIINVPGFTSKMIVKY